MLRATPVAPTKTAALSRVLDSVPKGYSFWTAGSIAAAKLPALARKFDERYGIACSVGQRQTRKKAGQANALLVLHAPEGAAEADWLLLATAGSGPVWEMEVLRDVRVKPRLIWLGYELVRHAVRGRAAWTWRRPDEDMRDWYGVLGAQLNARRHDAVRDTLACVARQPGFAGVRAQSWNLFAFARKGGYVGEVPFLYFVQKLSHGPKLLL